MISPSDLMKRVGVGGRLVPFFKLVGVYFVVGGAAPSATAVAAKCAPVLCLLLLVLLHHLSAQHPKEQSRYSLLIMVGLSLSALGDALLVWPQQLVAGMAAFAGAHVAYILAWGWRPRAPLLGLALYAATALYCATLLRPAGAMKVLVPAYSCLLASMAWRGQCAGRRWAAPGALLFLVSDAVLGYTLFGGGGPLPLPYRQALVMSTYYLGQLGIALSALQPPPPPPPQPQPHAHTQ